MVELHNQHPLAADHVASASAVDPNLDPWSHHILLAGPTQGPGRGDGFPPPVLTLGGRWSQSSGVPLWARILGCGQVDPGEILRGRCRRGTVGIIWRACQDRGSQSPGHTCRAVPRVASAARTRERNRALFDGDFGGLYGFYIARERLARVIASVIWGADVRPFYASMRAIAEVSSGGVIVDAPCGAGVAFRGLGAEQRVRYIALDLSPRMLERARRRASDLGLTQVELVEGDALSVPVEDASVDLFLSYFGLHCFADPELAVTEMARCLRSGGRVVGGMITRGRSARHRLLVRPGHGVFGPGGSAEDLRRWLDDAGLGKATVNASGLLAYFSAER
jgi:SAM-dependent methyltransferase